MPVRYLDLYATTQKNLIQVQPLSILKDTRVGIDGNVWLRKVISASASEQYYAGIGGTPSCLQKAIEKDLEGYKSNAIHPLFVFSGLSLIRKERPYVNDDNKMTKRKGAWEAVNAGKMDLALSTWSTTHPYQPDLIHLVLRILKENNVDYMRAPYGAGAQLVYLERNPKQIIHAIHAGSELLMFDIDRVITSIDFSKQTFTLISKKAVLQDLMLSDDQFLDLCILAGFDHCPTFPPLAAETYAFKSIHDLLRQHRTGFNAVKAHADNPQVVKSNYVELFCKARCAMRHQPILTDEGHIEPMNLDQPPSDIHEFIGYCLPDEVYYYMSRGIIAESNLNTLLCGYGAEHAPLCNGELKEYRNFLTNDMMKLKAQTLALLTARLHPFYTNRKVSIVYWFESNSAAENVIKPETAPVSLEAISHWKSGKASIEKELKKLGATSPTYASSLALVSNAADAASTVLANGQDKPAPLSTLAEVQSRHLLKLLQLRSFVETSHVPSAFGKSIVAAFKTRASAPVEFHDALFVALELIRADLLTNRPYSSVYSTPVTKDDATATKAIRLISRAVSLIGARFKGVKSWAGPLNRDLLAFNSMNKVLTKHLRHLSEALLLEMLLSNECPKDTLDFTALAMSMPFANEVSTVLGLLVKEYLEAMATNSGMSKDSAIQTVEEKIGSTSVSSLGHGVKEELQRGFAFWEVVFDAVKALEGTNGVRKEVVQEFVEAQQWLKSRKL